MLLDVLRRLSRARHSTIRGISPCRRGPRWPPIAPQNTARSCLPTSLSCSPETSGLLLLCLLHFTAYFLLFFTSCAVPPGFNMPESSQA